IVHVSCEPAVTGSGESLLVSARSAAGFTIVCALALLLAVFGSKVVAVTDAVLLSPDVVVGVSTIVTVASAPFASPPSAHTTIVVPEQVPWLADDDTNDVNGGSESVTETPAAASGPLLCTVRV